MASYPIRLGVLLAVLLLAPAWAADGNDRFVTVTFVTNPPGARVFLSTSSTMGNTRGEIGLSGSPIRLDRAALARHAGHLEFVFRLAGFEDRAEVVGDHYFDTNNRYPARGSVQLDPTHGWWSYAAWYWSMYPAQLSLLGGLALGSLLWWTRRRQAEKSRLATSLQRLERLNALTGNTEARGDELRGGTVLGSYIIQEKLGEGGTATVYRALPSDTMAEADARAVKLLRQDISADPDFRQRFEREYRVSSGLIHPHIVLLFDTGEHEGRLYFVMELLGGQTLRSRIGRPLDAGTVLGYLRPLMQALAFMHRNGVIHRDLKPENLMLTDDGRLKIMDFGLAVAINSSVNVTQPGSIAGTPRYMAPEQVLGRSVTGQADQYAVGVITFEMLTGEAPFDDENMMTVLFKHVNETIPSIRTARPDLPAALDTVVQRMLAKEAASRYADMDAALQALEEVLPGTKKALP